MLRHSPKSSLTVPKCQYDADGMANCAEPDQLTALEAVLSGPMLFAWVLLPEMDRKFF